MLSLKVGDWIQNKAGDNKAKVVAVLNYLNNVDEPIVAICWNTHEGNPQSNVAWHTLEGMEKLGWRKVEAEEEWPKKGDEYWLILADGSACRTSWCDVRLDGKAKDWGNCHHTEAEALAWKEKVRNISNP